MKKYLSILGIIVTLILCAGVSAAESPIEDKHGVIIISSNIDGAVVKLLSIDGDVISTGTIQNGTAEFHVYKNNTEITHVQVSAPGYTTELKHVLELDHDGVFFERIELTTSPTPSQILGIVIFILLCVVGAAVILQKNEE